jgi:glycosyltransferase involved in cell wall biosynthesis
VTDAEEIERRAIQQARLLPYPSPWAADSAATHYGAPLDRVHVVPWGANLDEVPPAESIEPAKPLDRCELLFLGRDWERKGGPLAYETVLALRDGGLDATLSVCGCTPTGPFDARALRVVPRIDKSDPAQAGVLQRLLLGANFLLQPTRYESLGLAYAEASAHGTPSIATDTGGVSGVIKNGWNGFLLPPAAGASAYAALILKVFSDRPRYLELVASSRREYETRLNWDAWGRSMATLIATI